MKSPKQLLTAAFIFTSFASFAQTTVPSGFTKGSIVLGDGTALTGFLKDNLRKDASVQFISEASAKKVKYQGTDIISAAFDGTDYICIKGDFFKVVCKGDWCFLQKSSDASGIPVYNGSEAIFSNGTEGKPGDYFLYSGNSKQLKKVSKATIDAVAADSFAGCAAAIDKAKTAKNDIAKLKDAVEIFNSRNNQ